MTTDDNVIQLLFDKAEFLANTGWMTRKEKLSNFKEFVQLLDCSQQKTFTMEEVKEIINKYTTGTGAVNMKLCNRHECSLDKNCVDCLLAEFEKEME